MKITAILAFVMTIMVTSGCGIAAMNTATVAFSLVEKAPLDSSTSSSDPGVAKPLTVQPPN